ISPMINWTQAKASEHQIRVTEAQTWDLLSQILPQLRSLHHHGQIYGDIRPATVQQPSAQRFSLVDLQSNGTDATPALLSPDYAAPEQLQDRPSPASDLYSLGLVCIHGLTGLSPFDWLSCADPTAAWTAYLPEPLSPALHRILTRLTAPALGDRYPSADAVIQDLVQAGATLPVANAESQMVPASKPWHCNQIVSGATAAVNAVAIHPKRAWAFSGTEDGQIQIWALPAGRLHRAISAHRQSITALSLSPSGQVLAVGSDDKTLSLWQVQINPSHLTLQPLGTLIGHRQCVKTVAFHPDGTTLISGGWDKTLQQWRLATQKPIQIYRDHRLSVSTVAIQPQGHWMASGGLESDIRLWMLGTDAPPLRLTGHHQAITCLAFHPQGNVLASGSNDGTLCLWTLDPDTEWPQLKQVQTLSAHGWTVSSLVFSPQGDRLFSSSWDHTIKAWDRATGEELFTLQGHTDSVYTLAMDPSGQWLVSGSRDRTLRIWQP
ncbi:MAG: WD40 repeat domain-containing serine/threonine-protein kinase, partial [Thermosynechococcaceae cyanobacterium]